VSKHRRERRSPGPKASVTVIPAALLGLIGGGEIAAHVTLAGHHLRPDLPAYGYAVLAFLAFKLGLAILYRPPRGRDLGLSVAAIITVHNEDPVVFGRSLTSLLRQTRLPAELTVVDDGSASPDCLCLARSFVSAFTELGVRYRVVAHDRNLGKREGLANGFRAAWHADIYLCVDSDTELKATALEKAIAYFSDSRVQAVTGTVLASNWDTNFLTRLIDLRYANAFLGERAAYSAVGSVLCACGSLALYRGEVVRKYLDDFLSQHFLGQQCTYGDDRRLTYYCLREGRVLLAPDAVAWTTVPERMDHFLRQQLRWSKSFIRESWFMLTSMPVTRVPWWLSLLEVITWAAFTSALLYTLLARPLITGQLSAASYLAATLLLAYARSGHYFRAEHANLGRFTRLVTFALAPVYGLVHMILLLPLRLVAVLTLRDNSWGTRTTVEVRAT
jgi:hyaluronan synthase